MAGHTDAVRVHHAKPHALRNRCVGIGDQLIQVRVIGLLRIADDRESSVVEDRVSGEQQQLVLIQPCKRLVGSRHLASL